MFKLYFFEPITRKDTWIGSCRTLEAAQDEAIIKHDAYHKLPNSARGAYYYVEHNDRQVFSTEPRNDLNYWEESILKIQDKIAELLNDISYSDQPYYLPLVEHLNQAKDKLTDALVDVETSRSLKDGEYTA